jgi:hypothetical protein
MAGKPKPPKPKPINQARIRQVEADVDAQTSRINEGLSTYKVQALTNIGQQTLLQKSAISNSIADAQAQRVRLEQQRLNTIPLLRQRNVATQQMNTANTALASASTKSTQRQVGVAQNTKIMKRRIGGV